MTRRQQILIVANRPKLADTLVSWLGDANYDVTLVTTFAAAKTQLQARPDLLIAEVKLGEYNGLHLALRARAAGIPALVVGPRDPVLEHDARELGATYLSSSLRRDALLNLAETVIAAATSAEEEPAWVSPEPPAPVAQVPVAGPMWRFFSEARADALALPVPRRLLLN